MAFVPPTADEQVQLAATALVRKWLGEWIGDGYVIDEHDAPTVQMNLANCKMMQADIADLIRAAKNGALG